MLDDAACALVDAAGVELCLKFHGLQRGKCRFGVECHRSHKAPCDASLPIHRQLLDAKDAAEAAERAIAAEQQRAAAAIPIALGASKRSSARAACSHGGKGLAASEASIARCCSASAALCAASAASLASRSWR